MGFDAVTGRLVSLVGILAFLALCWALSEDRRSIRWRTVVVGLLLQIALGAVFLSWPEGNGALRRLGGGVDSFLRLAQDGNSFVFGVLADMPSMDTIVEPSGWPKRGFVMAFQLLPTIIFFSAFMAVLYHVGVMQVVVKGLAWVMARFMGTSGSESLSAAANVFVGQIEAPLLVKPFLAGMTRSEVHALMVGGFATIAGGVFMLYVGFGVEAGHLMVASVMAAPAGLVVSKLLVPECGESQTMGTLRVGVERTAGNVVEAAANGAIDGLKLAVSVAAMLIAFLGLLALANALLGLFPGGFTLQELIGFAFYPFAFLMGTEWNDIPLVAQLLGTKIVATELIAYEQLTSPAFRERLSPRSFMLCTYALCGFANFASVAVQIGGIGALAPERKPLLAQLGMKAMFGGAVATCMTAAVAGMMTP